MEDKKSVHLHLGQPKSPLATKEYRQYLLGALPFVEVDSLHTEMDDIIREAFAGPGTIKITATGELTILE